MSRKALRFIVVYCVVVLCLIAFFAMSGCSMFGNPLIEPAGRLVQDWGEARADGEIDEADVRVLDRDVGYVQEGLDEAQRPLPLPSTGIPWIDLAIAGIGLAGATGYGTHKYTMRQRDRSRAKMEVKA